MDKPINYQVNCIDLGNGKFAQMSYLGPINYYNGSKFVPIDTTIISSLNPLYDYEVTKGIYQTYFKANPTEGQVIKFMIGSEYITYQPMALNYRNDLNQLQQIKMISGVQGTPNNNKFLYENAYGSGIDLQYSYWNDYLKEDLIINSLSDLIDPKQYIIDGGNPTLDLDFILSTNANKIVIDDVEWDKSTIIETSDDIYIKDELGNVIYYLKKPYAYDSNGSLQLLKYQFKKVGQSLFVTVKTPYSWISDPSRVYPIYIDPDTGATSPGTMADDATIGTITWSNPNNAKTSNNNYAVFASNEAVDIKDNEVKIVKSDASIGTTNKASGAAWDTTDAYASYGGAEDLWDESWDDTDINHANFGVVISARGNSNVSHYLKATNFGFSVSGTIVGIKVEIEKSRTGFPYNGNVDHIRITVYYTLEEAPPANPLIGKPLISPDIIKKATIR